MAQDSVTITSIDTSTINEGYVNVSTTLSVGGSQYVPDPPFQIGAVDPVSVATSVLSQAEVYKQQILSSSLTIQALATLSSLVGTVIDL